MSPVVLVEIPQEMLGELEMDGYVVDELLFTRRRIGRTLKFKIERARSGGS